MGGSLPEARVVFELHARSASASTCYEIAVPVLEGEAMVSNNTRAFVIE